MQTKLKDVLHLYLGCEVEFGYDGRKKKGHLIGKDVRYGWQVFDPSSAMVPYHHVRDELIKPILRPLSDMTNKECFQFHTIKDRGLPPSAKSEMLPDLDRLTPQQMKYLLSIGIDLFGLLESGQALDATKTSHHQTTKP